MARTTRRRAAIIGVGVCLLAAWAAPASAHYVYEVGFTYESSDFNQCVIGYAESSHGQAGNGYMKGYVMATKSHISGSGSHATRFDCNEDLGSPASHWIRPPQNLAIKDYYFRLNPNPQHNKAFPSDWSVCEYSDWFYNQKSSYVLSIAGEMRGPTICGNGYYGTLSYGDVNNGGWLTGSIWSGGHKLPVAPKTDVNSTGDVGINNVYAGLDAALAGTTDGEVGTDGLLNPSIGSVTVAGPDGNPVLNPNTGEPILVNLDAMSTPPTNLPGNVFQVATDLAGQPTFDQLGLPTGVNAGPHVAPVDLGTEFYIVPTHVAAEALIGAP
ncbi:MAG: hypothetical protein QOC82_2469 [Frankiaceae bacterium]|jgi:hypothetical protein|nr:hypothetical protein [Frankiaceae bacterium]